MVRTALTTSNAANIFFNICSLLSYDVIIVAHPDKGCKEAISTNIWNYFMKTAQNLVEKISAMQETVKMSCMAHFLSKTVDLINPKSLSADSAVIPVELFH